jgi:hypothetical protein
MDIIFISPPPKDVRFESWEELMDWYKEHPKYMVILKNVAEPPKEKQDDTTK